MREKHFFFHGVYRWPTIAQDVVSKFSMMCRLFAMTSTVA